MKVILLQDVKGLGKKNDVVDVKDSYARNGLIKPGKAKEANSVNLNDLKLKMANDDKNAQIALDNAKELADKLKASSVKVGVKIGENGRAFGTVTSKEISDAIKEQLALEVDKKKIVLKDAIKTPGDFDVAVKLHPQVMGQIKVIVEGK